jgi:DNA-binding CsgD family transcriptional regulator
MFSETASEETADLREEDIRAILRLAGEAASMPNHHSARKSRLMAGLCKLVGATAWASALGRQAKTGGQPVFTAFEQGGFDQEQFTRYLTAQEHPDTKRHNASMVRELEELQTLTHPRNLDRFPSKEAEELWRKANLGPAILSLRPLADGTVSGIALYRRFNDQPFDPRETRIVHIFLSEFTLLHEENWPAGVTANVPKLQPRERVIFSLLLQGYGRKPISTHLGISINTVSGYVKNIYRQFGVQSHAELMKHFQSASPESFEPMAEIPRKAIRPQGEELPGTTLRRGKRGIYQAPRLAGTDRRGR